VHFVEYLLLLPACVTSYYQLSFDALYSIVVRGLIRSTYGAYTSYC